ncbi:hypothetical protein PMSD_04975 [Paenibacillus macquariensis subsp. defensor]|nr:hypothetical protein PMSD_04975 [Paenibacillus macquariensis subsp. defensor]
MVQWKSIPIKHFKGRYINEEKIITLCLGVAISMLGASAALAEGAESIDTLGSNIALVAGNQSSEVTAGQYQEVFTDAITGQHQYGKITLTTNGKATAFVYKNCTGTWEKDAGQGGFLFVGDGYPLSESKDFYMDGACQYKLKVQSDSSQTKGYIRNY